MNPDSTGSPPRKDEAIPDIDKITPMKAYMQEELKALRNIYDQKLTLLMANQSTTEELTLKLDASEKARRDLQSSIEETIKTYEENDRNSKNYENGILKENKDSTIKYNEELSHVGQLESSIIALNNKIADVQRALKVKEAETIAKQNSEFLAKIANTANVFNKEKEQINLAYKSIQDQYNTQLILHKKQCDTFQDQVKQGKEAIYNLTKDNDTLKVENANLEAQNKELKVRAALSDEKDATIKQLTGSITSLVNEYSSKNVAEQIKKEFEAQIAAITKEREDLREIIAKKDKEIAELNRVKGESISKVKEQDLEMHQLKQSKCRAEELVCPSEDKNAIIDEYAKNLQKCEESIITLKEYGQSYLNELESVKIKYFDCVSQLSMLKNVNIEKEEEIFSLKDYIIDLRSHQDKYLPFRNDPIDAKLAEFINKDTNTMSLKLLFVREKFGVYLFGKRRVVIKLEQDKIIVRVGGGFLAIDEFVEIYTPIEIEKIQKKLLSDSSLNKNKLV